MGKTRLILILIIGLCLSSCIDPGTDDLNKSSHISWISTSTKIETLSLSQTITIDPTLEWINQEIDFGREQVYLIVAALDKYFYDHNEYPESIESLVPDYLFESPRTISGDLFNYQLDPIDIYFVGFYLTRKGGDNIVFACGYTRANETWECSAGHP